MIYNPLSVHLNVCAVFQRLHFLLALIFHLKLWFHASEDCNRAQAPRAQIKVVHDRRGVGKRGEAWLPRLASSSVSCVRLFYDCLCVVSLLNCESLEIKDYV